MAITKPALRHPGDLPAADREIIATRTIRARDRRDPTIDAKAGKRKDLKLKFIMSIGGRTTGGMLRGKEESTPLVDGGFMYVADTWTRVTKFDVRSSTEAIPHLAL